MALVLRTLSRYHRQVTPLLFRSLCTVFQKPSLNITTTMPPSAPSVTSVISNIAKSPRDGREYRGLVLGNQMKVLLISDPVTDISAAGLSVAAGSMHDPRELPGLFHYVEHMLFLGTDFSSEVNEYSRFLSEHGGFSNAYTAQDHTCYYFDVAPESLQGALMRFSRFFIHPLFTEEMAEREVNAVNSEHEKNIPNDSWRMHQLEVTLANPKHPYCNFATGNRDTLWTIPQEKKLNVRKALLDNYESRYSANIMNLIVLGKESLDELQDMTENLFRDVVNRELELPRWSENPYGLEQVQYRVNVVPIKDIRQLRLTFPVIDVSEDYKSLSDAYLSHLIGHEGTGSLLSLLKKRSLVNNLSAGSTVLSRGNAVFKIDMELTIEGLERINEIVCHVFQYLKLLRKSEPQEWIWNEIVQLLKISFEYQEKMRPQVYVAGLSSELHRLEMPDVLSHGIYSAKFKPQQISEILDKMTPDNCLVIASAQEFKNNKSENFFTEHYYGIEYSKSKIDPALIKEWEDCPLHDELKLPTPNAYIPQSFELKERDKKQNGTIPRLLKDEGLSRVWFLQDNEFKLPRGVVRVELFSPLAYADAHHANLNSMLASAIKDALTEEVYPAALADLQFTIKNTHNGIELLLKGYDDKIPTLMELVLKRLTNFTLSQERFEILKDYMVRALKNWADDQPYLHAIFYIDYLLHKDKITQAERLEKAEEVNKLTLESLKEYVKEFLAKLKFEILLCGNFSEEGSLELVNAFEKFFQNISTPLAHSELIRNVEVKLPENSNLLFTTDHKTAVSSCATVYFQTGPQSDRNNVILELIESIASEPCYNQLRTTEQLGYIVATQVRRSYGTQGLKVLVQSNFPTAHVDSRIHAFLEQFRVTLKEMPDEQFQKHVNSLSTKKAEKPKKISERALRLWGEISAQHYYFDRQEVELAVLKNITKEDVIQFYAKYIISGGEERKRLGVHVNSIQAEQTTPLSDEAKAHMSSAKRLEMNDVKAWKGECELYPPVDPSAALLKAKL